MTVRISDMCRHATYAAIAVVFAFALPATSSAQDSLQPQRIPPGETRVVEGAVLTPRRVGDSTVVSPVSGVWVTVHRVGSDTAGPVDSSRTDNRGRYLIAYKTFGSDAVYFAATTYAGIAYFTPPLRQQHVSGTTAEITVFDTTSRSFPLAVRGRHLIVSAIDSTNHRTVIEVFELENDSLRTLIAHSAQATTPTWSHPIPLSAIDVRANDTEVSLDAFKHDSGRVSFYSPIAPGLDQFSFSYRIEAAQFPVVFSGNAPVLVYEVLLEEPRGTVNHELFTPADPVMLEGRTFKRFLAQDVPADARVLIELPPGPTFGRNIYIAGLLVLIGAVMLLILTRSTWRRTPAPARAPAVGVGMPELPLHEQLAREIAALDAVYAQQSNPSQSVRDAYERRRAELKDALAGALAESGSTR